jgi:hypothetical protein
MPNFFTVFYQPESAKWVEVVGDQADHTWLADNGPSAAGLAAIQLGINGKYAAFPIAGAEKAFLQTDLGVANGEIIYTAQNYGTGGNSIRVRYVVSGNNTPLSVSVAGNDITVNLATNGSGVATSTASQVVAAVTGSGVASALVAASLAPGNSGAGVLGPMAYTNLAFGTTGAATIRDITIQTVADTNVSVAF